jgi:hypothetical protein
MVSELGLRRTLIIFRVTRCVDQSSGKWNLHKLETAEAHRAKASSCVETTKFEQKSFC